MRFDSRFSAYALYIVAAALALSSAFADVRADESATIIEFHLPWDEIFRGDDIPPGGSTHEIAWDADGQGPHVWITGQNYDGLARVTPSGEIDLYRLPRGSGPHGILYDRGGRLWVSLEFEGAVVQIDERGRIRQRIDIRMHPDGTRRPINPAPHGIALGADGYTIWFTGKRTSTIGKINYDGSVEHFEVDTLASLPIYLHAGPDGNMWGTELLGNRILRVRPNGKVREYPIPTANSRPIALVPGPDGRSMWFSEEAGRKVARIDMKGRITEFDVPITQPNMILAGIAFDNAGNLWTQGYIDRNDPEPAGDDYLFRFDRGIQDARDGDAANVEVTLYRVPTRGTVMHRIVQGPDGNIWFTELATNKVGVLVQ